MDEWLNRLTLAPEKMECVIVRGSGRRNYVWFMLEGVGITPSRHGKYLGTILNDRGTFDRHIRHVTSKAEARLVSLAWTMPNIADPRSNKRRVLSAVVHSILLYDASVWIEVLNIRKHRNIMTRVQRQALSRVAPTWRITSSIALQLITGMVAIDLMAQERAYVCWYILRPGWPVSTRSWIIVSARH